MFCEHFKLATFCETETSGKSIRNVVLSWVGMHDKDLDVMNMQRLRRALVSEEWTGQGVWRRNCVWHVRMVIKFQLI